MNSEQLESIGLPAYSVAPSDLGDLVFVACNVAWLNLIDMPQDKVIGRTALEIWPIESARPWEITHRQSYLAGSHNHATLNLPDGPELHVYLASNTKPEERVRGVTVIVHPTASEGSKPSATQAQLTHEMEKFISMAAHDLRTPMRNVQNLADMLREDFVDMGDGKLELIDMLENVAIKATALISDILSHAQTLSGERTKEEFDFYDLCQDIHQVVDPPENHKILPPHVTLEAEKPAVQIIVRNLLDNAIKHGRRSKLEIGIAVEAADDGMLDFTVSDNGEGFSDPSLAFLDGGEFRMDSGYGMLGIKRMIGERGGEICAKNNDANLGGIVQFSLPGRVLDYPQQDAVA